MLLQRRPCKKVNNFVRERRFHESWLICKIISHTYICRYPYACIYHEKLYVEKDLKCFKGNYQEKECQNNMHNQCCHRIISKPYTRTRLIIVVEAWNAKIFLHLEQQMYEGFVQERGVLRRSTGEQTSFLKMSLSFQSFEAHQAYPVILPKIRDDSWSWAIDSILIVSSRNCITKLLFLLSTP